MFEWMLFRVIMVAFFILATSFFVAAEFALVSVRETRIQQLIAHGHLLGCDRFEAFGDFAMRRSRRPVYEWREVTLGATARKILEHRAARPGLTTTPCRRGVASAAG